MRQMRRCSLFALAVALTFISRSIADPISGPIPAPAKEEITLDVIYGDSLTDPMPSAVTWVADGSSVFFTLTEGKGDDKRTTLYSIATTTGERKVVLTPEEYNEVIKGAKHGDERPSGRSGFSGFRFSKDGQRVLLIKDGDIHVADLVAKSSRQITASSSKERHARFSPDDRKISYVRDHNLYVYDLERGLEMQITKEGTVDSTFAESDWVYDEELSLHGGYWWSPTSTHIALLHFDESEVPSIPIVDYRPRHKKVRQQRYPKAGDPNPTVELYLAEIDGNDDGYDDGDGDGDDNDDGNGDGDGDGDDDDDDDDNGEPTKVDLTVPDEGYIARVDFVHDGSKVVVQLLNRKQDVLELVTCDVKTGEVTPFFKEKSQWWINVHNDFRSLKNGQFLWSSERDGWNHLYLFDSAGKKVRQLTKGRWVVASVAGVDEKSKKVYFTGTKTNPLERHLYEVSLGGGKIRQVTRIEGTHRINMDKTGRWFVDSHSAVDRISRMDLYAASGEKIANVGESSSEKIDALDLQRIEFLEVPTEDGLKLPAFFVKPASFDPTRKYPVLFYVYGGPQSQTVVNRWGGSRFLWHQMLANEGILVFSMDNRASFPMGLKSAGVIYEQLCVTELSDLLQGVRFLETLPYVDTDRLGIWGWSYGGTMASYSILNAPDTFRAAVSVAPVTDWRNYDSIYTERYMNTPQNNPEGYESTSVVEKAGELTGHLLISHGTGDDNVHFQNAIQLTNALIEEGKNFDFLVYPGGKHGIGGKKTRKQMFTAITKFLFEHLTPSGEAGPKTAD